MEDRRTQSYQELTRRSLATMQARAPLAASEPDRRRIELPELLPLSDIKRGRRNNPARRGQNPAAWPSRRGSDAAT